MSIIKKIASFTNKNIYKNNKEIKVNKKNICLKKYFSFLNIGHFFKFQIASRFKLMTD